jgi:hypothetical protein
MKLLIHNSDPADIWGIFTTGGELTESSIRRMADDLLSVVIDEHPDNERIRDDFHAWSLRTLDTGGIMLILRPDSKAGRTSSHAKQYDIPLDSEVAEYLNSHRGATCLK